MDDPEKKTPQTPLERWLNTTPYVTAKVIGASFLFVWLLGLLFGLGEQIYAVTPNFPPGTDCPECTVLDDVVCRITERQCRITFKAVSQLALTRSSAWRLLRIRVFGPFFDQEMRPMDNGGVYSLGATHTALHYELNQEGKTRVELWCLDQFMQVLENEVTPWDRETKHSIVHANRRITNACVRNGSFVLFTKSSIRSVHNGTWLGNHLAFARDTLEDYAKEFTTHEKGFVFRYTPAEIAKMSAREVFEKILVAAFTQSHFGETVMFQHAAGVPEHLLSVVRRATEGRFTRDQTSCFTTLNLQPNVEKANGLSDAEHLMMKRVISQKYETGRTNLVMTSNPSSDEIRKLDKNVIELDTTDLKQIIKNVSNAKAMIAYDDNDQVIHAFWLQIDSPLILIVPPKLKRHSEAVVRLQKAGKKIIFVEGETDGATSDDTPTLTRCLAGDLDIDSPECHDAFSNVAFKVNYQKVDQILRDATNF